MKEINFDTWLNHGVDIQNRLIYFGSSSQSSDGEDTGIDAVTSERIYKNLRALESLGDGPITIVLNSIGGSWYHGMAIYDTIKACKCHCTIIVYGQAMSMGSVILQAADRRVMMPNSRFMMHYGKYSMKDDHTKIVERFSREIGTMNREMEAIYVSSVLRKISEVGVKPVQEALTRIFKNHVSPDARPVKLAGRSLEKSVTATIVELINFDIYLSASETVSIGLADEIGKVGK